MTAYWELLRDPRWQRKRLEIMERAEFSCEHCGADDRTLNVHHTYYERGCKPWEYDHDSLKCFCEDCHEKIGARVTEAHRVIGQLNIDNLCKIVGFANALAWIENDYGMASTRNIPARSAFEGMGILDAIGVSHLYGYDDIPHARQRRYVDSDTLEQLVLIAIEDYRRRKERQAASHAAVGAEEDA